MYSFCCLVIVVVSNAYGLRGRESDTILLVVFFTLYAGYRPNELGMSRIWHASVYEL